jgi:hypothetical protein
MLSSKMASRKNLILVCAACTLLESEYVAQCSPTVEAVTISLQKVMMDSPEGPGSGSNDNVQENTQLVAAHVEGSGERLDSEQKSAEVIDSGAPPQPEEIIAQPEEIIDSGSGNGSFSNSYERFDYGMFQNHRTALEVLKLLPPAEQEIVGLVGKAFGKENKVFSDSLNAASGAKDPKKRFLRRYAQVDQHLAVWPEEKVREIVESSGTPGVLANAIRGSAKVVEKLWKQLRPLSVESARRFGPQFADLLEKNGAKITRERLDALRDVESKEEEKKSDNAQEERERDAAEADRASWFFRRFSYTVSRPFGPIVPVERTGWLGRMWAVSRIVSESLQNQCRMAFSFF